MKRILIQAGHVAPREPGFEGGTGTVREQEFTGKMQTALANLFRKDGRFNVTLCPGDIPDGWTGDVFLSLHIDGAGPAAHGFSLGWPANGRPNGRGPELANRIARRFLTLGHPGGHHADNYTAAMRGYYGWSRTNAPTKVLIEHGFSTNKEEQAWMFSHINEMAAATFASVLEHEGLPLNPVVKGPRRIRSLDGSATYWDGAFVDLDFIPALRKSVAEHGDVRIGNTPKG